MLSTKAPNSAPLVFENVLIAHWRLHCPVGNSLSLVSGVSETEPRTAQKLDGCSGRAT